MSRSVRRPNGAPRPTGSFIEPRRGVPSRPTVCARRRLRSSPALDVSGTASRRRAARPLTELLGIAVLALAPAFDCLAESRIGRLFSTVEQRIELDRVRDRPAVEPAEQPAASGIEPALEPRPTLDPESERDAPSPPVTVNGVVLRSDGHHLAWVDGVEVGAGAAVLDRAGVEVDHAPGGRIRLRWPERRVQVDLKPGQTIDVVRGRVFEAYEPRPLRGVAETSGPRAPESDIATSVGIVRSSSPLPLRGSGLGPAED